MTPPNRTGSRPVLPIVFNTVLALSALYAPQPLLPTLSAHFQVSREAAAALTTVTFIPLALAPLAYGFLLESVATVVVLRIAVLLLAVSEVCFACADHFGLLMLIRLLQGLLIPAVLTGLMTDLSARTAAANIPRTMAYYVAATIFGGFVGRALSGALASWFGWRASFFVLAVSLAIGFGLLLRLPHLPARSLPRPRRDALWRTLRQPALLPVFLVVFCLFFVFAAVMNYLPFRLTELSDQADSLRIGLMYSGYTMGLATSLAAPRVGRRLGGGRRVIGFGIAAFGLALAGLAVPSIRVLFVTMFLFCGTTFLVHATASGLANSLAVDGNRGLTNGLYVAFYYGGGAVGSFAPGLVYRQAGWGGFLMLLGAVVVVGWLFGRRLPAVQPANQSGFL